MSTISFDVMSKNGTKLTTIKLEPGYKDVDVQFALWDAGIVAAKFMARVVVRDATPGSLSLDVYIKGTRTPSYGLKQNLSSQTFGDVANLFKING
jgi:hypothetical protein